MNGYFIPVIFVIGPFFLASIIGFCYTWNKKF